MMWIDERIYDPKDSSLLDTVKVTRPSVFVLIFLNSILSRVLNVHNILLHDTLVMSRDAINRIVERMHTPINLWSSFFIPFNSTWLESK